MTTSGEKSIKSEKIAVMWNETNTLYSMSTKEKILY